MMPRKRWEAGTNPAEMLNFLHMKLTDREARPQRVRKVRLYLVALCRQFWSELPWVCRVLAEIAERWADETSDDSRERHLLEYHAGRVWDCAWQSARRTRPNGPWQFPATEIAAFEAEFVRMGFEKPPGADEHVHSLTAERFVLLAQLAHALFWRWKPPATRVPATAHCVPLLRDIAGDPYRPIAFKAQWRTDTAMTLARQMYESREFSAMPILADAIQDAGCNNDAILTHCRDTSLTHVRGCWVVDLVLNKG